MAEVVEADRQEVRVAGRDFSGEWIEQIIELVRRSADASRFSLARQVCELTQWRRSNGALKLRECRDLLEALERRGSLTLPAKRRQGRPAGVATQVPLSLWGVPRPELNAPLTQCLPIELRCVESRSDHAQWRELVGRYHYLGCATAYGAKVRYMAVARGEMVVGCMEYSSAAWRLAPRDQWIGWSETQRRARLPWVVQHSRFLILPWVHVRYLASHLLSLSLRRLADDWEKRYARRPVLAETMVDRQRFVGTCYRAANWIDVGTSQGRGRRDRQHQRHGAAPKRILVYALTPLARQLLCA
jgi:hypothetical protein